MKTKSSLKTFLAGKNPLVNSEKFPCLKGADGLIHLVGFAACDFNSTHYVGDDRWYVDVLDDGTAITYCPGE